MLLIHLYRRCERIGLAKEGVAEFPLTQQHMADALGLSLVHTNKTLRALQKTGLHEISDGGLRILNFKAVERLADWSERPMRRVPMV
jgi:CRP-like cAMP-binding protein